MQFTRNISPGTELVKQRRNDFPSFPVVPPFSSGFPGNILGKNFLFRIDKTDIDDILLFILVA